MHPDLAPGYTLSFDWIRRLWILDWLVEQSLSMRDSQLPDLAPLVDASDDADADIELHVDDMEARGWLALHRTFGGVRHCAFQVTPSGLDFRDQVHSRRGDVIARRKAARDAFLRWMYEQRAKGIDYPTFSSFMDTAFSHFYGQPFSTEEIDDAGRWLYERGFIRGTRSAQMSTPPRPAITPQGEDLVESGRSVNDTSPSTPAEDAPLAVGSVTVVASGAGPVNIVANSPHATQGAMLETCGSARRVGA